MTYERIEEMLRTYRNEVGRCGHLEAEIRELEAEIRRERAMLAEEVASPHAQVITDMPRGTGVGNPTEKFGMLLASGWEPDEIREKVAKLAELREEIAERGKTVEYVNRWMSGLPERERWVITKQMLDGVVWRDVVKQYQEQFGEYRSKDTIKRIRDRALDLIYDMAE